MAQKHLPRLLDKASIGMQIRRIRESVGMTQQQLADYLGLSRGQGDVSRWEQGDAQPRADVLLQIAALAGQGMEAFQEPSEPAEARAPSSQVEADQALVDALLDAVGRKTPVRVVQEMTDIHYSTVNKWRRQALKSPLSAASRDAARAYLSQHHPDQMPEQPRSNGNRAHGPREQGERVDVLALLQGDDMRADRLVAAQLELAVAFRIRAETIAKLVTPAAPSALPGRALAPGDFAGGASAPEVEIRYPAKNEDPPPH